MQLWSRWGKPNGNAFSCDSSIELAKACNDSGRGRYAFPFFFDPNFDAQVKPIFPDRPVTDDARERWDRSSVHEISGTYGQYLLGKVSKVFPELGRGKL